MTPNFNFFGMMFGFIICIGVPIVAIWGLIEMDYLYLYRKRRTFAKQGIVL